MSWFSFVIFIYLSNCASSFVTVRWTAARRTPFNISKSTLGRGIHVHAEGGDVDVLKEKASRLRKEADELEQKMRNKRNLNSLYKQESNAPKEEKSCNDIRGSSWIMSYRFASDAIPRDKDTKIEYYNGKIKIELTPDGYTNLIECIEPNEDNAKRLQFKKFWGWDEEISSEDSLKYVLFSADVQLPKSDPNYTEKPIRFYFQARADTDETSGNITLNDATVTLKKDIEPPAGFWGFFSGQGILAQFRYCGDFLMKPC
jgi:hypothetical protein